MQRGYFSKLVTIPLTLLFSEMVIARTATGQFPTVNFPSAETVIESLRVGDVDGNPDSHSIRALISSLEVLPQKELGLVSTRAANVQGELIIRPVEDPSGRYLGLATHICTDPQNYHEAISAATWISEASKSEFRRHVWKNDKGHSLWFVPAHVIGHNKQIVVSGTQSSQIVHLNPSADVALVASEKVGQQCGVVFPDLSFVSQVINPKSAWLASYVDVRLETLLGMNTLGIENHETTIVRTEVPAIPGWESSSLVYSLIAARRGQSGSALILQGKDKFFSPQIELKPIVVGILAASNPRSRLVAAHASDGLFVELMSYMHGEGVRERDRVSFGAGTYYRDVDLIHFRRVNPIRSVLLGHGFSGLDDSGTGSMNDSGTGSMNDSGSNVEFVISGEHWQTLYDHVPVPGRLTLMYASTELHFGGQNVNPRLWYQFNEGKRVIWEECQSLSDDALAYIVDRTPADLSRVGELHGEDANGSDRRRGVYAQLGMDGDRLTHEYYATDFEVRFGAALFPEQQRFFNQSSERVTAEVDAHDGFLSFGNFVDLRAAHRRAEIAKSGVIDTCTTSLATVRPILVTSKVRWNGLVPVTVCDPNINLDMPTRAVFGVVHTDPMIWFGYYIGPSYTGEEGPVRLHSAGYVATVESTAKDFAHRDTGRSSYVNVAPLIMGNRALIPMTLARMSAGVASEEEVKALRDYAEVSELSIDRLSQEVWQFGMRSFGSSALDFEFVSGGGYSIELRAGDETYQIDGPVSKF